MTRAVATSCLLGLLLASPASAFRTSQDSQANRDRGIGGRIAFEPQPVRYAVHGGTSDVDAVALREQTAAAFQTWTEPACVDLAIVDAGSAATPAVYGDDRSVIEWVEDGSWSSRGFSRFTIGLTTNQLLRVGDRWTIDESDMELNADGFRWVIDGGDPDADPVDVRGLVVHEAGHFLGLLHTCEITPIDGASACPDTAEPETMWPRYTGENQRTLEPDDVAGICYLYPSAPGVDAGAPDAGGVDDAGASSIDAGGALADASPADAGSDAFDAGPASRGGGGCGCAAAAPRGSGAPLLVSLLAWWWRRRRCAR